MGDKRTRAEEVRTLLRQIGPMGSWLNFARKPLSSLPPRRVDRTHIRMANQFLVLFAAAVSVRDIILG